VKTVAPHAGVVQLHGNGEAARDVGIGGVKRGVEAGDLRQARPALDQGADRRQVVRLMERRKGNQFFERGDNTGVEPHRLRILHPAVDDAVADRREFEAAALPAQKIREIGDRAVVTEARPLAPGLLGQRLAVGAARGEAWRRIETLDLAANDGIELPVPLGKEQELDAGRAGV
jgi:hypothetical protein